jgi:K+-sensing histidine kinase KdpD
MYTKFASAERALEKLLRQSFKEVSANSYVNTFLDAIPAIGLILNKERQVVFANKKIMELLNLGKMDSIIGMRPGELLKCKNSNKEIGGCGTSENCSVCGAVNTILESQQTQKTVNSECRILTDDNDCDIAFDFSVTATPFELEGEIYTIYTMVDISDEKRRKALEKIFFHDIINKAGSLQGLMGIIKNLEDKVKIKELTDLVSVVSEEMIEEILAQRQLNSAENGELEVNKTLISSSEIIKSLAKQMQHHSEAHDQEVIYNELSDTVIFETDPILLKRILLNMLKNALEASPKRSAVTIACKLENGTIHFNVHNSSFIPRNLQLQIFQRSFSTKGSNRGLGTYSMKLLGEKYLNGKVSFTSHESEGTVFTLALQT